MCISLIFVHHYKPSEGERQTDAERVRPPLELSHVPPKRLCHSQTIYLLNVAMMDKMEIYMPWFFINWIFMCLLLILFDRDHSIKYIGTKEKWIIVLYLFAFICRSNIGQNIIRKIWNHYRDIYCIVLWAHIVFFNLKTTSKEWCNYIKPCPQHLKLILIFVKQKTGFAS